MLRFVQEDKIGYGGGANLYAYVAGAVLDARDPSGMLMSWSDIRGFIPFCTFGGQCLNSDGSVTGGGPEIYLDGVSWGGGGRGGISGTSIGSITGRGFGSLLPGRVEGGDDVATRLIAACRNDENCNESIELWEAIPGGFAYVRTTDLVTDEGLSYFPNRDGSYTDFVGGHIRSGGIGSNNADIYIGMRSMVHPSVYTEYGRYPDHTFVLGHELLEGWYLNRDGQLWENYAHHNTMINYGM